MDPFRMTRARLVAGCSSTGSSCNPEKYQCLAYETWRRCRPKRALHESAVCRELRPRR
jgi:hypothetical protein